MMWMRLVGRQRDRREHIVSAADYFERVWDLAAVAAVAEGLHRCRFRMGPYRLECSFAGELMGPLMARALAHLREDAVGRVDIALRSFDSASSGVAMPAPPWDRDAYLAKGAIRGWREGRYRAHYIHTQHVLQLMDVDTQRAIYWVQDPKFVPWWERVSPFRQILHWWACGKELQPIHAGAVGLASGGVLIAGSSGAGKSTSTASCLRSPLGFAGDDYVLLDQEGESAIARSLYSTTKIVRANLYRLPWLSEWVMNPEGGPDEKATIYVNETMPEKIVECFPIRAILMPRVTGKVETKIVAATAGDAMRCVAPTPIFQLNGDLPGLMKKVARLVRQTPAYWLEAGTDLEQIPLRIAELLEWRR